MTFKAEVTEVTHNPDVCVYCVTIFRPRFFFVLTLFLWYIFKYFQKIESDEKNGLFLWVQWGLQVTPPNTPADTKAL